MKNNQMTAKIFALALALVFAFILAACGSSTNQQESKEPQVPEEPVVLPEEPQVPRSYCYRTDEATLIEYWQDPGQNLYDGKIIRWNQAPIVKIVTESTPMTFKAVKESVERLNEALPEEYKMEFVEDAPIVPRMDINAPAPDGEIHVEFLRELGPLGWATNKYNQEGDAIASSRVQIHGVFVGVFEPYLPGQVVLDKDHCDEANSLESMVWLIAHEILHSLGIGHVDASRWGYDSIMTGPGVGGGGPVCTEFDHILKDVEVPRYVDLDALRVAYTLENGSYPEDIRIDESEICANRN